MRNAPSVAVIAAATMLTLGVGSAGFAAGMITGADIKDNTVSSADIKDSTLRTKDLSGAAVKALRGSRVLYAYKGPGIYFDGDTPVELLRMDIPVGRWVVSVSATAFPGEGAGNPAAFCSLKGPNGSVASTTTTITGEDFYATLGTQLVVRAYGEDEVSFECFGPNAGVNEVTITAVEARTLTNLSPKP